MDAINIYEGLGLAQLIPCQHRFVKRQQTDEVLAFMRRERRDCTAKLISGLRKTGKTTIMRHALSYMTPEELEKTAWIDVTAPCHADQLIGAIDYLTGREKPHVFVDNIGKIRGYGTHTKIIADVHSHFMDLVFAGPPVQHELAISDTLMGCGSIIDANFLSFHEWRAISKSDNIWKYGKQAGVFGIGNGREYVAKMLNDIEKPALEYLDSAFRWHSLRPLMNEGKFQRVGQILMRLLTAIFLKEVVTIHFKNEPEAKGVLDNIASRIRIIEKLVARLELHADDIESFCDMLQSFGVINDRYLPVYTDGKADKDGVIIGCHHMFAQPALRTRLAFEMLERIKGILKFSQLDDLFAKIRKKVIRHAMLDAILIDVSRHLPKSPWGSPRGYFASSIETEFGRIDLDIWNAREKTTDIFVMAETAGVNPEKMLQNPDLQAILRTKCGYIKSMNILHEGKNGLKNGIQYLNLPDFIESMPERWRIK